MLAYAQAGHGPGDPLPGTTIIRGDLTGVTPTANTGVTPTANEDAREQLWPRLLAFLAGLPG